MKNKVIEEDLALLSAIGLKEDEIILKDEDIDLVIKCFDKKFYSSNFKIKDTFYSPFAGIIDFGSSLFFDYLNIFSIKNFSEVSKLIAMLHGTHSLDANLDWIVSDVNNPSISECICFRDELSHLDMNNKNHKGFVKEVKYLTLRDWVERHTKMIFALATIFLREPIRYCKALYSLNEEAFKEVIKNKNNKEFIINDKNSKIEMAYTSIIDLEDRGFNPEEVFKNE